MTKDLVREVKDREEALAAHVERIAIAWFEKPCDPSAGSHCNLELHDWEKGHPEDKKAALETVRFILALDKVYSIIDPRGKL